MCYEVCVSNNESNIKQLKELGFNCFGRIPPSCPYIGVQLGTSYIVGRSYSGIENPIVRIKHLPALMVLPTPLARLEYLYEEFLIGVVTYKSIKSTVEFINGISSKD